jgi:hypothetical protein
MCVAMLGKRPPRENGRPDNCALLRALNGGAAIQERTRLRQQLPITAKKQGNCVPQSVPPTARTADQRRVKPHSYTAGAGELDTKQGTSRESDCQLSRLTPRVHLRPRTIRFRQRCRNNGYALENYSRSTRDNLQAGIAPRRITRWNAFDTEHPEAPAFVSDASSSSLPHRCFMELLR